MRTLILFDAELQYRGPVAPDSPFRGAGSPVGAGDGIASGGRIRGRIRWSLFENTTRASLCEANHVGVIETQDGARIEFSSLGYFRRLNGNGPNQWTLLAALRFETQDQRYALLNSVEGILEGEFDMDTGRTQARAYARVRD